MGRVFEGAMASWREWQEQPWGRLRYRQAEANLARHLGSVPLRVLDLAGGDGRDAIPLAALGHDVTIADFTPAMLAAAQERAAAAGVPVRCVEADLRELPAEIADGAFDLVLCHNVLPYLDDLSSGLAAALAPVRAGGLLSVIAINRHSEMPRLAALNDLPGALAALTATQGYTGVFDTTVQLLTAEEVAAELGSLGCAVVGNYGIRAVCDFIADQERKFEPEFYAALERLELAVAGQEPYLRTARLFHLVSRKA